MDKTVQEFYGDRLRTRVCGLSVKSEKVLLVNHFGLYSHDFWAPPGGGIEFGQTAQANLEREFREETGLEVKVGDFLFACEFISAPFHAVELFFDVEVMGGDLFKGFDPETGKENQIISEVRYLSFEEINKIRDVNKHGLFKRAKSVQNLIDLRGYLKI